MHFVINTTQAEINMKYSDKTLQTSTTITTVGIMLMTRKVRKRISIQNAVKTKCVDIFEGGDYYLVTSRRSRSRNHAFLELGLYICL